MRLLPPLLAFLMLVLAGCVAGPPGAPPPTGPLPSANSNLPAPDVTSSPWILAASGELRESGPPYNLTYACGVGLRSAHLRTDPTQLWLVRPSPATNPEELVMAAYSDVVVQRMRHDGCDAGPHAQPFGPASGEWAYVRGMPGVLRLDASARGVAVNGTNLGAGSTLTMEVSWTMEGRHGGPPQNYTCAGTVTVTNLGRGTVHYTNHGWAPGCRPEGCAT